MGRRLPRVSRRGRQPRLSLSAEEHGKVVKNDGRRQFLHKWGITQATFDRYYLRRGTPAGSTLAVPEPEQTARFKRAMLKCRIKRAFS